MQLYNCCYTIESAVFLDMQDINQDHVIQIAWYLPKLIINKTILKYMNKPDMTKGSNLAL